MKFSVHDGNLRNDGSFIIWLLRDKTNPIITAEIVNRLWNRYSKQGLVEAKLHADEEKRVLASARCIYNDVTIKTYSNICSC
jgi:hypothetical protein